MFQKRIRALRMARRMTQQNMADLLNVTLNAYQKYEQGERWPPYATLIQLADFFCTSTDFLLGRDVYLEFLGVSVDEFL